MSIRHSKLNFNVQKRPDTHAESFLLVPHNNIKDLKINLVWVDGSRLAKLVNHFMELKW